MIHQVAHDALINKAIKEKEAYSADLDKIILLCDGLLSEISKLPCSLEYALIHQLSHTFMELADNCLAIVAENLHSKETEETMH